MKLMGKKMAFGWTSQSKKVALGKLAQLLEGANKKNKCDQEAEIGREKMQSPKKQSPKKQQPITSILIESSPDGKLQMTPRKIFDEDNQLLEDLMRELPVDEKKTVKRGRPKAVPNRQMTISKKASYRQSSSAAALPAGGKKRGGKAATTKKEMPKAKKPKLVTISSDEEEESSEEEEEDSSEESEDESNGDDEEESEDETSEDDGPKGKKAGAKDGKKARRFMNVVCGGIEFGMVQMAQCRQCQANQKELVKNLNAVGDDELLAFVVQCPSCLEGNLEFSENLKRHFHVSKAVRKLNFDQEGGAVEKTKKKKFKLAKAADDFKVTSGKYIIQIGQCGRCMKRQKEMSPEIFMEKGPKGSQIVAICQCKACVSANKASQSLYWKYWGIFPKTGNKEEKKWGKKY